MDNISYQVTAVDDDLHSPTNDDPFWTETLWLAFAVPERRITGAIYPVFRTNQGVCSLGRLKCSRVASAPVATPYTPW